MVVLAMFSSCGNSPLFNHKNAPDAPQTRPEQSLNPDQGQETPQIPDPLQELPGQPSATNPCPLFFAKVELCAKLTWASGHLPQGEDESVLFVRFWKNGQANPQSGPYSDPEQTVKVVLFMPSMGHGAPATKIEKLAQGTYRVNKASFFMPGDWEVRVQLRGDTNLVYDQASVALTVNGD